MTKKKILFITEVMTANWAFERELWLLKDTHECFITECLDDARERVESGVDKVVMFPFLIAYPNYEFNINPQIEVKFGMGYCFWKQELEKRNIPTIIVNIYDIHHSYIDEAMTRIMKNNWATDSNVTFFGKYPEMKDSRRLVELIKK
jgi:hypothetical protein